MVLSVNNAEMITAMHFHYYVKQLVVQLVESYIREFVSTLLDAHTKRISEHVNLGLV